MRDGFVIGVCWSVAGALGRLDGVKPAAVGHDPPLMVMDLLVAGPAQKHHVVDVGRAALTHGSDVVALTDPHVGSAAAAGAVAGSQRVHLSLAGEPLCVAVPQRHALDAEHHPADSGVAEVLLKHASRDDPTPGDLSERIGAVTAEMLHDGDVSRRPATTLASATAGDCATVSVSVTVLTRTRALCPAGLRARWVQPAIAAYRTCKARTRIGVAPRDARAAAAAGTRLTTAAHARLTTTAAGTGLTTAARASLTTAAHASLTTTTHASLATAARASLTTIAHASLTTAARAGLTTVARTGLTAAAVCAGLTTAARARLTTTTHAGLTTAACTGGAAATRAGLTTTARAGFSAAAAAPLVRVVLGVGVDAAL